MEMFQPQQHMSPTASPERQANNQDPFAAFAPGPAMPNVAAPQPPQQPPPQQPQDPWAAMNAAPSAQAPPAPMSDPTPAPLQPQMNAYVAPPMQQMPTYTAPAHVQQPTYTAPSVAQITPPVPQQPVMQMPAAQPPAAPMMAAPQMPPPVMPQAQPAVGTSNKPPFTDVYAENKEPDSPIGDVSAILNQEPEQASAQPPPSVPSMLTLNEEAPVMQQPAPTQMPSMQMQQQAPAPQVNANPFDFGAVASAMPSTQPSTAAPPTPEMPTAQQPNAIPSTNAPLSPPRGTQNNDPAGTFSPPMSPVNALAPQVNSDPFGYCFSPMASPPTSGAGDAIVPSTAPAANDPFGVFGGQQPPAMPVNNPPVQAAPAAAAAQPTSPSQAVVPSSVPNDDPFGVFGSMQPAQPQAQPAASAADLFGAAAPAPAAPTPVAVMDDDPFGVFSAPTPVAPPQAQPQPTAAPTAEDPWAAAGFGSTPGTSTNATEAAPPSTPNRYSQDSTPKEAEAPLSLDSNGLPTDGEYYEARVGARSLGVMFYTAREIKDSLLQNVPTNAIEAMGTRPIVSYVAKNSAAYNSGIMLGHTILEVNGQPVTDAVQCAELIRVSPRPLNVRCFNPNFEVVLSENKHLVKYDTLDMEAPRSSNEWKMKYVVVGGIVAQDFMVNMYYSKVRIIRFQ